MRQINFPIYQLDKALGPDTKKYLRLPELKVV